MSRSIFKLDAENPKILCSHQKDSVPTVKMTMLSFIWPVRKYLFNIRTVGVPIINWWYLILPDLYINSSLVYLLDSYDRFTSYNFLSWSLRTFLVTYLYLLTFANISCHIPSFLYSYSHFTLKTFLYWRLRTFPVTYPYFLMITDVSR